jgi:RecA-family ATPase
LANERQIDLIVIDALGMVLGDVDENAPEVSRVIANLKAIRSATGAAIACVHHPSKSGAQNANATTYNAAGSAKFSNFFEWTVELRRGEEPSVIVAEVVKHRGWAKAHKFAGDFEYKHFGINHLPLQHEMETFQFWAHPLTGATEKRQEAIREAVNAVLADGEEMKQSDLTAAAKVEADAATGSPVGEYAIRMEVKAMIDEGLLVTRRGERNALWVSLL